jgi:tetratricopeptide (TPR) repeat protein
VKTALLLVMASSLAFAQRMTSPVVKAEDTDQKIRRNEKVLTANPKDLAAESELTAAWLQKLRENGDGSYLDRAAALVDRMLTQDAGNYEAMRFQNEIDLQRHDFKAVEDRARDLLRFEPSDAGAWGNLGDASMELGKYEAAGEAYAKMFAIRPGIASYNRIAWFRFVTGDPASAISFMQEAVEAGAGTPENTAWCKAELGDMYFKTGKLDQAMEAYQSALALFPTLHRALAGKGRVDAARGNSDAAISSFERAQAIMPMIEYAGALEDLYTGAGVPAKARQQRDTIDIIDRLGAAKGESTNRNLALILADHHRNMAHALALVQAEISSRPDVYTWDALSWVLCQSGSIEEAKAASAKARRFNTPEPKFHEHAAIIAAAATGKNDAAVMASGPNTRKAQAPDAVAK